MKPQVVQHSLSFDMYSFLQNITSNEVHIPNSNTYALMSYTSCMGEYT